MNIRLLSDLHLEFAPFTLDQSNIDVLVLAGDINVGSRAIKWLEEQSAKVPVVYILGNHEYYSERYPCLINKIKALTATIDNLHILENDSVLIDGVAFHGCTLWTDFALLGDPRIAGSSCQQKMNDFKKIRKEPSYAKMRSIDIAAIHQRSKAWLIQSLSNSVANTNIVITHHAPSIRSISEIYRDDIICSAYASNLESLIKEHRPNLWLHRHDANSLDYHIASTRIICNPRGYRDEFNESFEPNLIITP